MPDLLSCLKCLVEKDVEELELDFCPDYGSLILDEFTEKNRFKLPCILGCKTLTHFRLNHSDFRILSNFSGFSFLAELCLFNVNITDEMLATCPSLEILHIRNCFDLSIVKICGTMLQLKSLSSYLDNMYTAVLHIHAPNLRVFHFNGDCSNYNFSNLSSLVDAIICAVGGSPYDFEYNRVYIIDKLIHVEILTLCYAAMWSSLMQGMMNAEEIGLEVLPITFHNLHELPILLGRIHGDCVSALYCFFEHCTSPALEKLFIELDFLHATYPNDPNVLGLDLSHQVFCNLRMVKINSFRGYANEVRLVKFLLSKAIALELRQLVSPIPGVDESASLETSVSSAVEQLLRFLKASSEAQILLYEYGEDDKKLVPTHTKSQYAPSNT